MSRLTYRIRTGSHSDTHITQCGCHYCDGAGHQMLEMRSIEPTYQECLHCEGTGFLANDSTLPAYAEIVLVTPHKVKAISNDYSDPVAPVKQAA